MTKLARVFWRILSIPILIVVAPFIIVGWAAGKMEDAWKD